MKRYVNNLTCLKQSMLNTSRRHKEFYPILLKRKKELKFNIITHWYAFPKTIFINNLIKLFENL